MNKQVKKKKPLKLTACIVALSLWGLSAVLTLSSSPVMAAETASNVAQEQVAFALYNKGIALDKLHRYEEALAAYNDLITRFGNSQDTKIQEVVANALLNKGFDLGSLHRYEEALAAYND
ncbi:MAG: tetratricopeptide repeat protein, partial [Acetobacter sp.]|nr:tetratricopeptide repeat protein [Acetobacter sp.]